MSCAGPVTVDRALADSVALGLGPIDLVDNPWAVMSFLASNPSTHQRWRGCSVALRAHGSLPGRHTAFTGSIIGVRDGLDGADKRLLGSRRGPDERGGHRIDEDGRRGREPGGDGGGHFDNDWAGRAILERYLRGGGDWTITDDPDWSEYMKNNQVLREQLRNPGAFPVPVCPDPPGSTRPPRRRRAPC